jgi:DNA-binding MurR/RpiR family transcriptional regulator
MSPEPSGQVTPGGQPAADAPSATAFARIHDRIAELTASERKVARALLAGPPTVGLESVQKFAERAEVSGPTVSRFVARLGYANYAEFQDALRADLSERVRSPLELIRARPAAEAAPTADGSTELAPMTRAVERTLTSLSEADLTLAAELLADVRVRTLAIGGWFSSAIAAYLVAVLRRMRARVQLVPAVAAERAGALADLSARDVVVVYDFRRYERDTVLFAQAAQRAGARIVLVTDQWLSPVADIAQVVLLAEVGWAGPTESLTPAMALTETLLTAVSHKLGDARNERLERYEAITAPWLSPWSPLPVADGGDQAPVADDPASGP